MILQVKVFPNARKPRIIEKDGLIRVYVNAPAVDGKANKAVVKAIAEHLQVRKSAISIIKGLKSRNKTIDCSNSPLFP